MTHTAQGAQTPYRVWLFHQDIIDALGCDSEVAANVRVLQLISLVQRYASECADCAGTGTTIAQLSADPCDMGDAPCKACADIRAALSKAGV